MSTKAIKTLFAIAAVYDVGLGLIFGLAYRAVYEAVGSALPNHPGYVQLPALFIIVFGIGFWMVSQDPIRNKSIIPLGIMMKVAFSLVVFGHLLFGRNIPFYIPFGVLDLLFAALFFMAHRSLQAAEQPQSPPFAAGEPAR